MAARHTLSRAAVLLTWVATLACATVPRPAPAVIDPAEDAKVAVLERLVKDYGQLGDTVFLCDDHRNPSDSLIARVARLSGARIKPCLDRMWDETRVGIPVDREKRAAGVIIGISRVTQLDAAEYQMEGGYACGNLCAASFEYRVRRDGSGWAIVSQSTHWIS